MSLQRGMGNLRICLFSYFLSYALNSTHRKFVSHHKEKNTVKDLRWLNSGFQQIYSKKRLTKPFVGKRSILFDSYVIGGQSSFARVKQGIKISPNCNRAFCEPRHSAVSVEQNRFFSNPWIISTTNQNRCDISFALSYRHQCRYPLLL